MPLTAAEKKRRIRARGANINPDSIGGRTMASAARSRAYLKLQASRAATARRLSGQKATTKAELEARKAPEEPLTHKQIAAGRRERATRGIGMGSLIDALKSKKKRED